MKSSVRIFVQLLLFSLLLFALSALAIYVLPVGLTFRDLLLPGIGFPVIIALSFLVFIFGISREAERQPMFTMVTIGLKFVLSGIFALTYFIILKRTGPGYIVLFFLLYLAFTFYLLKVMLKVLKVRSLK
ncbi:MAG: hypothetical protein KFF49_06030 [Bacteroidales bacterium]|nr:hypothetical protein [Bacteroidales bacterium]